MMLLMHRLVGGVSVAVLFSAACGEVQAPAPPADAAINPWEKVATLTGLRLDPRRFGYTAAGFGSRIFFGPDTDSVATRYWRSVDVSTGILSAPLSLPALSPDDDFCACGYTQVLVATSTNIYMFGNYGAVYSPSADAWSPVASYDPFRRGESAGAYVGGTNTILMIGGRGLLRTALRYDVQNDVFAEDSGMLPIGFEFAVAYAPPGDNRVYLAGGDADDSNLRHLLVHVVGSGTWTRLPDAPADLGRGVSGMGQITSIGGTRRLFVSTDSTVYLFNVEANAWDRELPLPGASARTVMVNDVPYAIVQNGEDAEVHKLLRERIP